MNSRDRLKKAAEELREKGIPDPEYDSGMLLAEVTGIPYLELRMGVEEVPSESQENAYRELLRRRGTREPLQYILGNTVFLGIPFLVRPGVLIPRPETELLAEWALILMQDKEKPAILDLCCGSGCLGLSLRRSLPGAAVTLTDLSPEAVRLSRENAGRLNIPCEIRQGDLWEPCRGCRFDCIVSNPPYIPSGACRSLQPEVLREPLLALDGGSDGLAFYRRIAEWAAEHLKPDGILLLETGDGEAEQVAEILRENGAEETEIRKDYSGMERMVLGRYHRTEEKCLKS